MITPTGRASLESILANLARLQNLPDDVLDVEGPELSALDERIGEITEGLAS